MVRGDVKDLAALERTMDGHDTVIHLASNPDIARAAVEPDIDFREGTYLTQQVVEAMRRTAHAEPALRFRQRRLRRSEGFRSRRKISARWFRSPPTAQASWPAKR